MIGSRQAARKPVSGAPAANWQYAAALNSDRTRLEVACFKSRGGPGICLARTLEVAFCRLPLLVTFARACGARIRYVEDDDVRPRGKLLRQIVDQHRFQFHGRTRPTSVVRARGRHSRI